MSISTTINDTLGSVALSYPNYVNPVVEALTEREYDLSDQIVEQVVENFSVDAATVKERLSAIGMAVRPEPEPEPQAEEVDESVEGRISRLEASVGELVALARRHLGA